jgi:hypothetical protein
MPELMVLLVLPVLLMLGPLLLERLERRIGGPHDDQ